MSELKSEHVLTVYLLCVTIFVSVLYQGQVVHQPTTRGRDRNQHFQCYYIFAIKEKKMIYCISNLFLTNTIQQSHYQFRLLVCTNA